MTEAEWLACEDPGSMVKFLRRKAGDRKLRLFACVCSRRVGHLPYRDTPTAESDRLRAGDRLAIETAERFADGSSTKGELANASKSVPTLSAGRYCTRTSALDAALESADNAYWFIHWHPDATPSDKANERISQANHLRDIFGNPFRPVTFSPSWRTDTAVALARQMYDSRDFGAMPILADALQDAGCDHDGILGHCRDANATHTRGCWVVDLVLGKQ